MNGYWQQGPDITRGGCLMKRLSLIAILVLCCAQAEARLLSVGSEYSTIQSAINNANNGDVIIVEPNTYYENINFLGKAIVVRSFEPNDANIVAATIIDGNQPVDSNCGSVVTFNHGEDNDSILEGFTITGGSGTWLAIAWQYAIYWNRCGGGVVCYNMSEPTIHKNVITHNTTGEGGGIYIYGDPVNPNNPSNPVVHVKPVITNNTLANNSAIVAHGFSPPDTNYSAAEHGDGGAIVAFQGCDPIIANNIIANNHAENYGGGMHFRQWSNGLIENNQIVSNNSSLGAGIHVTYTSSPAIRGNLIKSNSAGPGGGGGIYVYYNSNPLIEKNTITNNYCISGSGIAVYYTSSPIIRNNLIFKNNNGAGIRVRGGSNPLITHNTISNNSTSAYNGGIDCTENATPTVENNIICNNGSYYGIYVDEISRPVIRYNDVWGNSPDNYNVIIGNQTGINGNISVNPVFVNVYSNDYHLNYTSECINSGEPNFNGQYVSDFENNPRKLGQFVDIGAYEVRPVQNIISGKKYTKIQDAINDSNEGDSVVVTIGRYYENLNFNGKNIKLLSAEPNDRNFVEKTIIDGNGIGTVVSFNLGEDTNCVLSGFTITGGTSSSDYGGGIACGPNSIPAGPTIRNNIITGNTAKKGAGICLNHSFAHILNNVISNNIGADNSQGGGITLIDCLEDSSAVIANNIIAGNIATAAGGIKVQQSPSAVITNNVIAYNRATGKGKGVYGDAGTTIQNSIVWGHGGGSEDNLYNCVPSYCCIESGAGGTGNISADPNFINTGYWDDANTPANPEDDFFVIGNYHLRPSSHCIDAGDNNSIPQFVTTDIDGGTRIHNGIIDMGVDEFAINPIDLNADGIIDYFELSVLAGEWLQSGDTLQSDFYHDGHIDFHDLCILAHEWLWHEAWYQ
jgi:parallel beta-helix repeat protein